MIINDALPYLICNECALHLNVAYNLKVKCLTSEKYFLDYLNETGEIDAKNHMIPETTPEPQPIIPDLPLNDSLFEKDTSDQKLLIMEEPQLSGTVEKDSTSDNNEPLKKYVRPNLMAYFQHNTVIELSDTDSETDNEEQTTSIKAEAPNKTSYECPVCPENFIDLFTFNNHVKDHDNKVCKVCSRLCSIGSNLIVHFRTHRPDQRTKCPNCDYSSSSTGSVCAHIRKNHNKGTEDHTTTDLQATTKCNKCNIYFSSIEEFRIHLHANHNITVRNNIEAGQYMTLVRNSEALKCNICQRQLKNSVSFSLHMKLHQKNKLKYCYVCKISFKHNMFIHFKMCHPSLPPYKCTDHCNATFTNQKLFEAHQRTAKKRSIEPNSTADGANSSGTNKIVRYSLPSETNRHNFNIQMPPIGYVYVPIEQIVSFDCYICDLKLETEALLNEHIEAHEIKKCKKCYRVFGNFRALAGHFKLKHPTEETKDAYGCKDCGKTFDKYYSLKRHQLQHLKETKPNNE